MTKLARLRQENGLSQAALAEKSSINKSMIQFYEQGVRDINKAQAITVKRLADALGCRMEDLME